MLPVAEIGSAAFVIILYPRLDAIINYIFHSSFLTNHRFFLFQVDTGSFTRSIENCARPRSCRTAPPPSRPPRPTPRRRRWAVARAPDRAVPCWAACPVHLPRNRRTSTAIRRRACCRSFISVTAGMPPTCSYCAPSAPPECWTLPRNCPATTRNGASRTGRYPPRTPASRTWSNTSRRRSNLSVSVRFVCVEYIFFFLYLRIVTLILDSFRAMFIIWKTSAFGFDCAKTATSWIDLGYTKFITRWRSLQLYNSNNPVNRARRADDPQYRESRQLSVKRDFHDYISDRSAVLLPVVVPLRSFRYFAASSSSSGRVSGNRV